MSSHLLARPEDVLLAAVAYTRPQMLVLDDLIASQSAAKATLVLPNELLLHIRSDLQSLLVSQLADEATAELFEYESALVEGLCTDCYWWNTDVYGSDVWSWVEHGYRGACACLIAEDTSSVPSKPSFGRPRASSVSSLAEHELDPRHPSPSKRRIQATFSGIQIESRGQWLRTYISRTYFGGEPAWRAAKRILADLGCAHRFERANPNTASDAPLSSPRAAETGTVNEVNVATAVTDAGTEMPALTTTAAETVVALPPAAALNAFSPAHSDTESDLKKAAHRRAPRPCDFGALIKIVQAPSSPRSLEEDASVTLDRLTRELCLRPFSDNSEEPRIPVDCAYSHPSHTFLSLWRRRLKLTNMKLIFFFY